MKPKLEIESSSLRNPKAVSFELVYDRPIEAEKTSKSGNQYTLYTYTVMHEGQEHVLFAYSGLHNAIQDTGARKGTVLEVVKIGQGQNVMWDVSVSGEPPKVRQERIETTGPKQRNRTTKRFGEEVSKTLDTISAIINEYVSVHPTFSDLPMEEKVDLAITAFLNIDRDVRDIDLSVEESFVESLKPFAGGDGFINEILASIVDFVPFFESGTEVGKMFKQVGISSGEVDPDEPETWLRLLRAAKDYSRISSSPRTGIAKAKEVIRERYA